MNDVTTCEGWTFHAASTVDPDGYFVRAGNPNCPGRWLRKPGPFEIEVEIKGVDFTPRPDIPVLKIPVGVCIRVFDTQLLKSDASSWCAHVTGEVLSNTGEPHV